MHQYKATPTLHDCHYVAECGSCCHSNSCSSQSPQLNTERFITRATYKRRKHKKKEEEEKEKEEEKEEEEQGGRMSEEHTREPGGWYVHTILICKVSEVLQGTLVTDDSVR